ncbi:DNA recombination protein RmuC [Erysipelothrix tonsillarum]|uniref:DNA recombination protein RmuC n=1 Tax=Erysipelothrix tonsillarum TaxID=38402 RepID=UPI00035DD897|nr:DNA recombination protein RmuC [Erysipelothrix tonsillarum]
MTQYTPILLMLIIILLAILIYMQFKTQRNTIKTDALKQQFDVLFEEYNQLEQILLNQTHTTLSRMAELDFESREKVSDKFNQFTDRIDVRFNDLTQRNIVFEKEVNRALILFHDKMNLQLDQQFTKLTESVERRLMLMDDKVSQSLEQGFKKTNDTFTNIVERLSKIDEAQKKIDALSVEIVSLQDVLTDKKTRGTFGEVQLHHILSSIFGDKNDRIYQMQYNLANGVRPDAVLFAPEPLGTLVIDSKFPLENYRRMIDKELDSNQRNVAEKQFVVDCKKHIDAIASKYIIPGITSDQALMFVPAEAVFATINAYHPDILEYAQRKRVWLVSPTTLMSTLTTIQTILVNLEREKYASVIHDELNRLNLEFDRYRLRWDNLSKHIENVSQDVKDLHITSRKISNRFESISGVDRDLLTNEHEKED